ncbi:SagB family peptide dehydrogenase [Fundidesulfovibrio soli]|uniref:SagB family peptide dehydrogenase n=1 Tax=Fundidesulfovibrio soli TaxID=2922716 RepID=UPI001FB005DE|nr:SagB family peptide dehydrogenase [Fundidesulfovibrio soli]
MVSSATEYHSAVSYGRGRLSGLGLDWGNEPSTFKTYGDLPLRPLTRDARLPAATLWGTLGRSRASRTLNLDALSSVLFHAAGLTRSCPHRDGMMFYRACPSAGALYPCEIYVQWPGGDGLGQGLYHFSVAGHGLTLLRPGNASPASLGLPGESGEALIFVTTIFFRSAWKYRTRAYRYLNLDTGHMVEGLALGLAAFEVDASMEMDFDDQAVNGYLGVDPAREGCLAVLRAACHDADGLAEPGPLPAGAAAWSRASAADALPAQLAAVHGVCSARFQAGAAMPRPEASRLGQGLNWQDLPPLPATAPATDMFRAMSLRRSRRAYSQDRLPDGALGQLIEVLGAPLHPAGHPCENACLAGFLALPGFFLLNRTALRAAEVRDGNMGPAMAGICLDQLWMRDAALQVVFLADIPALEETLGPRGYRAALIGAGRLGHRLYLAAESLGLGACGVGAFYDAEAADVLGLPSGVGLLYAVTVGVPRRAGPRKSLAGCG